VGGAVRAGARVPCPARPCAREAGKQEEGERREREKEREVRELTLNFLKIFNGSSKKFEYESCSKNSKSYNFHFRHIFI
jgi:hypothetical protein